MPECMKTSLILVKISLLELLELSAAWLIHLYNYHEYGVLKQPYIFVIDKIQ